MDVNAWIPQPLPLSLGAALKVFIGALWYSPLLFGTRWMRLMNLTEVDVTTPEFKRSAKRAYLLSIAVALLGSYVVGMLITGLQLQSTGAALGLLSVLFMGLMFPILLSRHLWGKDNWGLLPINMGYEWFSHVLMGLCYVWLA